MSQSDKALYFNALKASGVTFDKHYREYKTDELQQAYERLAAEGAAAPLEEPAPEPEPETDPEAAAFFGLGVQQRTQPQPAPTAPTPVAHRDPNELAGARQNTNRADQKPIRVDPETGRTWYQEEVRKPAYPKGRARRVLKYLDPGVQVQTVKAGEYQETFEISGDPANAREAEVKITLPSYQVGIYGDPRFPFKVVCYDGNEGFDLDDVQAYYGGAELVPGDVLRKYVSNVLCYDMRSVIRAIEEEARRLQLQGRM